MSQVIIIAGPNGAGKSTIATRFLPAGVPFLNADEIAKGLQQKSGASVGIAAGRILLRGLDDMESARQSFALETNLANRSLAIRIPRWQTLGYHVAVIFVWLPSADMAVQRVASRVRAGGHDIPEAVIRRRYQEGMRMFLQVYQPLADSWRVYDNSGTVGAVLVAQGRVKQMSIWRSFRQEDSNG